jgi:histidinol dehydrogenase
MKRIDWDTASAAEKTLALQRPLRAQHPDVLATVSRIVEQVRADGDGCLRALGRRYDGVELGTFEVNDEEFLLARQQVPVALCAAMREAFERIEAWHRAGIARDFEIETAPGVRCGRISRGITRVGLYVPAGTAPLPSTALMLGVPASLAGCKELVMCTPPRPDGRADPAVLVAAEMCGIRRVFKLGGAQAIAAMAFGTESVPACDKLFGPGNAYVATAKQWVAGLSDGPAIDLPAGPSELLVIADGGANPEFVAADLLSQAEHGADSQVLLVSDSAALIDSVDSALQRQLPSLPRADTCRAALDHARLIVVSELDHAFEISNRYAPEHLILALRSPESWLGQVHAAGSVFLGDDAAEALGDYCSGTNHVLPTNGAARAWSGVSVASFQTSISVQAVSREGLQRIGDCAVTMARAEGLEAHAQAIVRRLDATT